jgi:hypothetical protein
MAVIRKFGEAPEELDNNVIDLDLHRARKAQVEAEELNHKAEESNLECADGVCVVKWSPRRPAA